MSQSYFNNWETSEAYFDVSVSKAVVIPEIEDVDMNGFAWSDDFGLIVGVASNGGAIARLDQSATTIDPSVEG